MKILLLLAIALISGLLLSRLAKIAKLPAVTAYLIAGILIGPYGLGALGIEGLGFNNMIELNGFSLVADMALGFIAFQIGNEFRLEQIKKIGKQAAVIGVIQAVVATIVVDISLIGLHFIMPEKLPITAAIVLGAIASATAPAATLMVVRQYKAKGPLTDILLPVVALDDAVGLVLFAISFGIARALKSGAVNIISLIVEPLLEIILSLVLGTVMGYIFSFTERFFHSRSKRLSVSVAFVFMTIAFSMIKFQIGGVKIGFSSLLVCMMLGTLFCNICDFSEELMDRLDRWTAPLYILFFVISGAELEFSVFSDVMIVLIGVVYILARSLGKYFGASSSAKMVGCNQTIVKNLGITLLPEAGVALGMVTMVVKSGELGNAGVIIANITLFAILIYELFGPALTRMALLRAGEIIPENKVSARTKTENK